MPRDGLAGDEVERVIASAVASCRIAPARAAHYRAMARSGTDIATLLAGLQPYPGNAAAAEVADTLSDDEYWDYHFGRRPESEEAETATRRLPARAAAARQAAAAADDASDQEVYEAIYGPGSWDK